MFTWPSLSLMILALKRVPKRKKVQNTIFNHLQIITISIVFKLFRHLLLAQDQNLHPFSLRRMLNIYLINVYTHIISVISVTARAATREKP